MFQVLVVEDDKSTALYMKAFLKHAGYEVYLADNGISALILMDTQHVDLIILDLMMPNMNGYELTEELRKNNVNLPIIMVTAKHLPADKHKGFLVGTDDYMVKPVDEEEMLLRMKALLRRSKIINEHYMRIGEVSLDYDSLTVSRGSDIQTLPQKEFYLLYKLLSYPDKIFTRLQLMDEIWGMDSETIITTVNVHITRLRKRFEHYKEFEIISIRGIGYKAVKNID